jgi:peroxiredoxin family protein
MTTLSVFEKIKGQTLEKMAEEKPTKRKLSLVASKGSLDMAYPPLILANAARMSGIDVELFFTFWGMDIITKKKMSKINMSAVGNPAFSMAPYIPSFKIPTWMGIIPGMSKLATWMMEREIAKLDFPPIPEFVEMLLDAGANLYACQMSADMMGLEEEDFVDGVEILGAMEFLDKSQDAQVMFI